MGDASTPNGANHTQHSKYDPNFTRNVIAAAGPNAHPRVKEVVSSLIRHLHDWAREIDLTADEWMEGVKLANWAGQMSDAKRNEGQLVCDVLGLESLVDEITYKKASEAADVATQSAILGPFYRDDPPQLKKGDTISHDTPADATVAYMYGTVVDAVTKKPLQGVKLDVWEASTNGLYEQQDENQVEHNLRGRFTTDENGEYAWYCLVPTPYPIPYDGPAGKLLQLLDRHPYRPGHIHLVVLVEGYKPLTTQIFDKNSKYLDDDSVFAVKDDLIVDFVDRKGDPKATKELRYDIALAPINKN
ncbi:hypothetical protein DV738_g3147, partial [Chaetothyriales sp. CBS 135597]